MSDTDTAETIAKSVHLARLKSKQDALDTLGDQLAEAKAKVIELTAAAVDTPDYAKLDRRYSKLVSTHDQTVADFAAHKKTVTTERAMVAAGITDTDDQELITWRYGRLAEAGRPELAAWLSEDGDGRADRLVAALFKQPDTSQQAADQDEAPARSANPLPQTAGGVQSQARPPKSLTREAVMSMSSADRVKPENRAAVWEALQQ